MKKIILIITLLITFVLGVSIQKAFSQDCCCIPIDVTLRGRLYGSDAETTNVIRNRQVYLKVVGLEGSVDKNVYINSFGYYYTTVKSCDNVFIQPIATGRGISGFNVTAFDYYDPPQAMYYLTQPHDSEYTQNFTMYIIRIP